MYQCYGVSQSVHSTEANQNYILTYGFPATPSLLKSKQKQYLLSFRVAIFLTWPLKMNAGEIRIVP